MSTTFSGTPAVDEIARLAGQPSPAPAAESAPPTEAAAAIGPVQVFEPKKRFRLIDFRELWRFRELLYFLAWRDVKVRYKQTILGAGWAVLKPLITVATFSIFFAFRFGEQEYGAPYYLFCFAGLLPWIYFSGVVNSASSSIVNNTHLFTKVSFPRLLLPLASVGECLVDFLVAFVVLVLMMVFNQVPLRWELLFAPLVLVGLTLAGLGAGILLSALTVVYRDFRHLVPFLVTTWLFLTPIAFMDPKLFFTDSQGNLPEVFEELLIWIPFNPAYGLIENFRISLIGGAMSESGMNWYSLGIGMGIGTLLLLIGLFYFRRVERSFADVI